MVKDAINVVHICSSKDPTCSAQRLFVEVSDKSQANCHHVICDKNSWLAQQLNQRSIFFSSFKSNLGKSLQLGFHLLRLKPDIVHWYRVESFWLFLFLRLLGIKQVLTLTRRWSCQVTPRFLLGVWLSHWIIAANPSLERSLKRRKYCSFKSTSHISSGFDLPPPGSSDLCGLKQEFAQKFDLNPDRFTVGVFIDGSKEKLESFFKLVATSQTLGIQWIVVSLRRASFKIRHQCNHQGIHLFEKKQACLSFLKIMDVLYLPRESSYESPFLALEALAQGVRLLSVAQGDVENLLYTGVTGYQLKRDHPEDLYKGLIYLLEIPCANRQRLMRDLLISRYSKRVMIEQLALVYQEVLHAHF